MSSLISEEEHEDMSGDCENDTERPENCVNNRPTTNAILCIMEAADAKITEQSPDESDNNV